MKKLLALFICLMLPLAALAEEIAPLSGEDLTLTVGEAVYTLGGDAAALVEALEALTGEPLVMTESVSCMFEGMDREFENEAVLVGAYPIGPGGSDVLESVMVFADTLVTARGAAVGMTKAEIEALYGMAYELDWNEMVYSLPGEPDHEPVLIFVLDLETDEVVSWMLLRGTMA